MSEKLVQRINPDNYELSPSQFIPAENVLEGSPLETAGEIFEGSNGNLQLGVWESTPYAESVTPYGVDEFCTVLKGKISLEDSAGNKEVFEAGESYLVRKEFSGTFRVEETARKLFVIFESAE